MKKYLSSLILVLTLPIGELHSYCSNTMNQNWIIKAYRPMAVSWNMKFAMDEIVIVFYFLSWSAWKSNRINKTTVTSFLFLAIMDTLLYFYNFKLWGFGSVYYWFIGFWLLAYFWKNIKHLFK